MGFFNKIAEGLKKTRDSMMGKVDALLNSFTKIDEDCFDELEESLIMADVGAVTSARICENLRKKVKEEGLSDPTAVKGALKEIIAQMTKIHQYAIMSAPTTSQYAAVEALRNGDGDIEAMKEEYDGRRRFLVQGLRELGLDCFEPRGAFYVFPCIRSTGLSSEEFCEQLLISQKVACIAGNAFGESGEGYVRMCYAASMHDLQEALRRIGLFLDTLKQK